MKGLCVFIGVALLACAGLALAQDYYYGGYPVYHSSTAAEGAARGLADMARSAGMYNLATSEAAINASEAQKKFIENRDQWTNTYFQMRDANRMYRAKERGPRPSMEDLVRYAQAGKPAQLSPSELDSITGEISWPVVLQKSGFAEPRDQLQALFTKRAQQRTVGPDQLTDIRQLTTSMIDRLQEQLRKREVTQMDYIGAKRFLESLSFQAQMPVG